MPLTTVDFVPQGPIRSADILQFANLFTGVMTDQPITFKNAVSIGGSQAVSTVPLKLYGAPTQTTHLIDFYPSPASTQPGFGLDAYGRFGWGPAGSAVQDTFLSRIGTQAGHASDTAGLYAQPALEVGGSLAVDGTLSMNNNVINGVSQLTFQPGSYLSGSSDHVVASNHLDVAFDLTVGRNLVVNGASNLNNTVTIPGNVALRWGDSNHQIYSDAGNMMYFDNWATFQWRCSSRSFAGTMSLDANGNLNVAGQLTVQSANGIYIGPSSRRIYYNGTDASLHMDWDLRIDSAHDVYTHSIHLVTSGDDCRIDTVGDMNYWGPNGSTNHRFHHVDGSWMGCQAANFVPQSTRAAKAGATVFDDLSCMTRVRNPISVYTWPMVNASGPPGQLDIGFMAEDMATASPEFCGYNSDGSLFGIQYMNITALLWGALRQLDARCQAKGI